MRCDSLGNLYVTIWGIGEIWKISPEGRLLKTIKTKGKSTTNVAFGGTDGKTIFVAVADRGIIEHFRVEDPGNHSQEFPGIHPEIQILNLRFLLKHVCKF